MKREDRLRLIEASERDLAEADRLTEVLEATTATVLSAVAADTAEGVITADQAAARRAAAAGELTQARERVDALRRGLPDGTETLWVRVPSSALTEAPLDAIKHAPLTSKVLEA